RRHREPLLRPVLEARTAAGVDGGKADAPVEFGFDVRQLNVRERVRARRRSNETGTHAGDEGSPPPKDARHSHSSFAGAPGTLCRRGGMLWRETRANSGRAHVDL